MTQRRETARRKGGKTTRRKGGETTTTSRRKRSRRRGETTMVTTTMTGKSHDNTPTPQQCCWVGMPTTMMTNGGVGNPAIDAIFMYQYRIMPKSLHTSIWAKPHQPKKGHPAMMPVMVRISNRVLWVSR